MIIQVTLALESLATFRVHTRLVWFSPVGQFVGGELTWKCEFFFALTTDMLFVLFMLVQVFG